MSVAQDRWRVAVVSHHHLQSPPSPNPLQVAVREAMEQPWPPPGPWSLPRVEGEAEEESDLDVSPVSPRCPQLPGGGAQVRRGGSRSAVGLEGWEGAMVLPLGESPQPPALVVGALLLILRGIWRGFLGVPSRC